MCKEIHGLGSRLKEFSIFLVYFRPIIGVVISGWNRDDFALECLLFLYSSLFGTSRVLAKCSKFSSLIGTNLVQKNGSVPLIDASNTRSCSHPLVVPLGASRKFWALKNRSDYITNTVGPPIYRRQFLLALLVVPLEKKNALRTEAIALVER